MATTECECHVNQVGGSLTLVYCPLHAAAGELLEALRTLALACIPSLTSKHGTRMPKREEVDAALATVRKAEGE
jgi:hypothetical protein